MCLFCIVVLMHPCDTHLMYIFVPQTSNIYTNSQTTQKQTYVLMLGNKTDYKYQHTLESNRLETKSTEQQMQCLMPHCYKLTV